MNRPAHSAEVGGLTRPIAPGAVVEVRTRFDGDWVGGFEVVGVAHEGIRVRRRSDGYEIPRRFAHDEIRPLD